MSIQSVTKQEPKKITTHTPSQQMKQNPQGNSMNFFTNNEPKPVSFLDFFTNSHNVRERGK